MSELLSNDAPEYRGYLLEALSESSEAYWHSVFLLAILNHAQAISFAVERSRSLTIVCSDGEHALQSPEQELRNIFVEVGKLVALHAEFEMDGQIKWRCPLGYSRLIWARLRRNDIRGEVAINLGKCRLSWTALWSPRIETASFWLTSIEPDDPSYPRSSDCPA